MLVKLFTCFIGVFVFFLLNGIAMETLTKTFGKQISTFYVFMVLIPSLFSFIFAKGIIVLGNYFPGVFILTKESDLNKDIPKKYYLLCSIFMMGSMLCSNAALGFITFPTQLILKSVKPISVLIFAFCAVKKNYSIYRLFSTLIIVFGVTLFMYEQYKLKGRTSTQNVVAAPSYIFGWVLVLASLMFDGFLAGIQERMRTKYHVDTLTLMYYINIYTSTMLAVVVLSTGELFKFVTFMSGKATKIIHLFSLGSCSAAGQLFVYYTITSFGPLSCSIITTIRKFFSVLFSVLLFSHWMSLQMWTCVVLVFVGLGVDIYAQYKGKSK